MKLAKICLCFIMAAAMMTGCTSDKKAIYTEGAVETVAKGFGGDLNVTVEFSSDKIENITVAENAETPAVGGAAIEKLTAAMLEAQSAEVDSVAGATISSTALKSAVAEAIAIATGNETETVVADGTYEGEAAGKKGLIRVAVTVADSKITAVEVLESHETLGFEKAFDIVEQDIINTNSTDVDTVTSATFASGGMIRATIDALNKAGMDKAFASKQGEVVRETLEDTYTADVVIVGAGGAGMAAAIEATKAGADVLVIDKAMLAGGNTKLSDGAVNASETSVQKELGIEDTTEGFYNDTFVGGGEYGNPELIKVLVENSAEAVDFIKETGSTFYKVINGAGANGQRCHFVEGAGAQMFDNIFNYAMDMGIKVIYDTEITELIVDNGRVTGAKGDHEGQTVQFNANNGVILATGGYGHNGDILGQYDENYIPGTLCTNTVLATGSGLILATDAGAALTGMEFVQKHPTCNSTTGDLLSSANSGRGFGTTILVNKNGQRFCEELAGRLELANAVLAQEGQASYSFYDQKASDETGFYDSFGEEIEMLIETGEAVKADTIEEACEFFGINVENFKAEIEKYNEFARNGEDKDFNRRSGLREYSLTEGPFYFIKSSPAIHHTMGGIEINNNAEVMSTEGQVIEGLYAAGEVTGGIHGNNRIGGSALDDIIVFGRLAGQNAAANK